MVLGGAVLAMALAQPPASPVTTGCVLDPKSIDSKRDVVPPKKIKGAGPVYPASARHAGREGTVVVELLLSASGHPTEVKIKNSAGADLDQAALEAARQWEYTPTLVLGKPCPTVLSVSMKFVLPKSEEAESTTEVDNVEGRAFAQRLCGLRIEMPAPRQHDSRAMHFPEGDVPIHQFRRLDGSLTYGIVCAQSADIAGKERTRQLDLMRNAILQSNDAAVLSERPITVGGKPGRELLARAKEYTIRAWLFAWGDRTANISVLGPDDRLTTPAVEAFFASFEIVTE